MSDEGGTPEVLKGTALLNEAIALEKTQQSRAALEKYKLAIENLLAGAEKEEEEKKQAVLAHVAQYLCRAEALKTMLDKSIKESGDSLAADLDRQHMDTRQKWEMKAANVSIDPESGLPCLEEAILLSWHHATMSLENYGQEHRLKTNISKYPQRSTALRLERARAADEILGVHARQQKLERAAAASLATKIEEQRGWSARAMPQPSSCIRSKQQYPNSQTAKRPSAATLSTENPLRLLFGGVDATEKKCPADGHMRQQFHRLLAETNGKETYQQLNEIAKQVHSFFDSYLQLILRTPPRHFSNIYAYKSWCECSVNGGSGYRRCIGATHSLGIVSSTFAECFTLLYREAAMQSEAMGGGARPALDFAIDDTKCFLRFLQSVVLWKWPVLLPDGTTIGGEANGKNEPNECSQDRARLRFLGIDGGSMVSECLLNAILPAIPDLFRLFVASSISAAAEIHTYCVELAQLPLLHLLHVLGIQEEYHFDLFEETRDAAGDSIDTLSLHGINIENTCFGTALESMKLIEKYISVIQIAKAMATTCKEICQCVVRWHNGNAKKGNLPADDLVPILQFLIIYTVAKTATLRSLEAKLNYTDVFLPPHLVNAEYGYVLALFMTATGSLRQIAASNDVASTTEKVGNFTTLDAAAILDSKTLNDKTHTKEISAAIDAVVDMVKVADKSLGLQEVIENLDREENSSSRSSP